MTHDRDEDQTQSFSAIAAGEQVAQYRILKMIGAGGMGEVYLAEDTKLARRVALKFLPSRYMEDEDAKSRFTREAQAAAGLNHPNILHTYEVSEYHGRPFFAMEYVEGRSLRDVLKTERLAPERVLELMLQICGGLREAHRLGVVHRDIKPANILLDRQGRARLADFGLARIEGGEEITRNGSTMGTVGYMSPEQVKAEEVDQRSDIFSLGVVLYEMVTGRQPFRRHHTAATLLAIVNDDPDPLDSRQTETSPSLQPVLDRALAKDRGDRYQSIEQLVNDLESAGREFTPAIPRGVRRHLGRIIGMIVIIAIAAIIIHGPTRHALFSLFRAEPTSARKHLAVLPLANVGDTPGTQAFCDGLMETLTSKLTQLEHSQETVWVVPANEVRERDVTSVGVARKIFGVSHGVTGSVQRLGDQIRVTLNLVDAKSTRQLRSMVLDDSLSNVPALQDSLVFRLARMLDLQVPPDSQRDMTTAGTSSALAYDFYLQGVGLLQRHWEEWGSGARSIDSSIVLFQRAIDEDSEYAEAHAALGQAYWRKYEFVKDPSFSELALAQGQRAVELNDQLASAQVVLGLVYKGTGQLKQAVQTLQRALDLDPVNYNARQGLASSYEALNELDQAEAVYKQIITLRPDFWYGYRDLAYFYAYEGRNQQAQEQLQALLDLQPDGVAVWNDIGGLYYYLGKRVKARQAWERSVEFMPNYAAYQNLAALHQMAGEYSAAATKFRKALSLDDRDYQVWINLASVHNLLPGNEEKATAAYRRAIELAEKQRSVSPRDPVLLAHLADTYAITGDSSQAVTCAELALTHGPENILVLARIGIVYEMLDQRDLALDYLGRALARGFPADDLESFPELSELRADERYDSLLARQSLPDSTTLDANPDTQDVRQ